jgi:endonuclease/exonuclease/phosphatase family metal-dependent hydrolase
MRYFICFLLPLLLLAKPVKIASYNVENLFDDRYQGTEYEEYIPGKHNWNSRMVEIKLVHIAEVICDLDADVIGLQEVENETVFWQLISLLKRVGCPYRYHVITHKKGAPIQVALLSRYRIMRHSEIVVSRAPKVRNILEAVLDIEGHPLTLFVNHWKSKAYQGYESKRIAYAKALKKRLAYLPVGTEYILLGDFNSDYNAYLTLSQKNNDTQGRTAFSDILHTRVGDRLVCKSDLCQHKVVGVHYSLWNELPVAKRWSQKFFSKRSTPDQIVLPASMFDTRGIDYVNHSFGVFHADYLFTKRGYINRWRYKHGKHMAKGYSDHLPIYAYFDTKPYIKEKQPQHMAPQTIRSIDMLYKMDTLESPALLKDAAVIFKRGGHAVVKQRPDGRGIYLYGCAHDLQEGKRYDLLIEGIKSYHGLREILAAYAVKKKGDVDIHRFTYKSLRTDLLQNEIVEGIEGIYRRGYLYVGDRKIPIYFKKKKLMPPEGSRLKITYGHIGYYKRPQLVIYSKKDFKVME